MKYLLRADACLVLLPFYFVGFGPLVGQYIDQGGDSIDLGKVLGRIESFYESLPMIALQTYILLVKMSEPDTFHLGDPNTQLLLLSTAISLGHAISSLSEEDLAHAEKAPKHLVSHWNPHYVFVGRIFTMFARMLPICALLARAQTTAYTSLKLAFLWAILVFFTSHIVIFARQTARRNPVTTITACRVTKHRPHIRRSHTWNTWIDFMNGKDGLPWKGTAVSCGQLWCYVLTHSVSYYMLMVSNLEMAEHWFYVAACYSVVMYLFTMPVLSNTLVYFYVLMLVCVVLYSLFIPVGVCVWGDVIAFDHWNGVEAGPFCSSLLVVEYDDHRRRVSLELRMKAHSPLTPNSLRGPTSAHSDPTDLQYTRLQTDRDERFHAGRAERGRLAGAQAKKRKSFPRLVPRRSGSPSDSKDKSSSRLSDDQPIPPSLVRVPSRISSCEDGKRMFPGCRVRLTKTESKYCGQTGTVTYIKGMRWGVKLDCGNCFTVDRKFLAPTKNITQYNERDKCIVLSPSAKWRVATIRERRHEAGQGLMFKIHYQGLHSKYDAWVSADSDLIMPSERAGALGVPEMWQQNVAQPLGVVRRTDHVLAKRTTSDQSNLSCATDQTLQSLESNDIDAQGLNVNYIKCSNVPTLFRQLTEQRGAGGRSQLEFTDDVVDDHVDETSAPVPSLFRQLTEQRGAGGRSHAEFTADTAHGQADEIPAALAGPPPAALAGPPAPAAEAQVPSLFRQLTEQRGGIAAGALPAGALPAGALPAGFRRSPGGGLYDEGEVTDPNVSAIGVPAMDSPPIIQQTTVGTREEFLGAVEEQTQGIGVDSTQKSERVFV